jgi:hypothetical protein
VGASRAYWEPWELQLVLTKTGASALDLGLSKLCTGAKTRLQNVFVYEIPSNTSTSFILVPERVLY